MSVIPRTTRRIAGALALLVAFCLVGVGLATPASAETVATWNGGFHGQAIKGADGSRYQAGQFTLDFGDTTAVAYCIDLHNPISPPATLTEQPWESATGRTPEQLSQIAWILDNYPAATFSSQWQAAAVQGAIWHFSDGWDLKQDPSQQGAHGAELVALYNEIVAEAAVHTDGSQPEPSLSIDPTTGSAYTGEAITYNVAATDATDDITVSVSGGGTFVDGADNPLPSPQTLPASGGEVRVLRSTDGSASVHAETTATAQAGRVFIQPGSQMLILGSTASATATADANGDWTPRPTGSISVTKAVSGTTAPAPGTGSFEICLTRVHDGEYDAQHDEEPNCKTFTAGETLTWDGLDYGQYRVTETTTGDFTTTTDPADGVVTLEDETSTATVTNTYPEPPEEPTGSISVTKAVSGTTAPAPGTGSFEICLTRVHDGEYDAQHDEEPNCKTFTAGETLTWDGLDYGQYRVTETTTGDFTTTTDPADGVVTLEDETSTATVTNTYPEPPEEPTPEDPTPPGDDVGRTETTNPPSTPAPTTTVAGESAQVSGSLPFTGGTILPIAIAGGLLLLAGLVIVLASRRRRIAVH